MRVRRPYSALRVGIFVAAALTIAAAVRAQELVTEIGAEQLVAATGDYPSLAYDAQGRGVVAWQDQSTAFINARRLSGTALGAPFQVNTSARSSDDPRVSMDALGNFIVV